MDTHLWIRQRTGIQGPFALEKVRRWIAEGRVRRSMEFSSDGDATWLSGSECPELFEPVAEHSAPKPPPTPRRRTRAHPARPTSRPRRSSAPTQPKTGWAKWRWVVLGLVLLWIVGTMTSKSRERARNGRSSSTPAASMRTATYRGQPAAIYERNFTYHGAPAGMGGDLLPAVAVEPRIVAPWNTLAALVRKVKSSPEVRQQQVHYICFQWHAELQPDEFGNDRGHRPAFWVILDVATIRRIGNPGAVAKHDWLGHYVESGRGRWR